MMFDKGNLQMVRLMTFVLRAIGVLAGASVALTIFFIARFGERGLRALVTTGAFGVATMVGWAITFIVGPFATVQLLRVRNSGRMAGIVLFGFMLLYYACGLLLFRSRDAPGEPILYLCGFLVVIVVVLLVPPARRACIAAEAAEALSK
jgi:hypothetical protein